MEIPGQKKCFFGSKQFFLGKKFTFTWYKLHIILNQICKFAITRKNDAFVAKIINMHLTNFYSHFCPRRKAANFCHPASHPSSPLTLFDKQPINPFQKRSFPNNICRYMLLFKQFNIVLNTVNSVSSLISAKV